MIVKPCCRSQTIDIPERLFNKDRFRYKEIRYARIDGYPDYFVSDAGDVISIFKDKPVVLKTWTNQVGHRYVHLRNYDDDFVKKRKYLVHRLVAEAFIPNPKHYPLVRHLNDIPGDDRVENLAWGTSKMNRDDSIRNGSDYKKSVYCFETGKEYRSCAQAAEDIGLSRAAMTNNCKGKTKTCGGYHFCYSVEKDEKLKDKDWYTRKPNVLKPVIAISPEGKRIRYESRKAAAEAIGIPECGISSVVNGHLQHTHGWRFKEVR